MSDDILSGGRIDESTSGPAPSKKDDRSRDILGEQKAKEQQDAVGGTQYAPRVEPPPPIPVAQEVAPPLPVVPSFDFNVSGSVLEEVREITRQAMVDAFKNVTINGQSPSIEGSAISFNVQPPQPSASEAFMFQSGEVIQVGPPTAVPPPSPQPREDVQTVVVSPPSRPREEPESISEQRERENTEMEARDQEIRVSLGLSPVSPLDRPSESTTPKGKSISEQNDGENTARAQRDTEVRASAGLSPESPMDEESDSAKAYKEAEDRRDARRESDPNFDIGSNIRQRGETPTEFKERQEQLKQEKIERAEREEKIARVRDGDLTEMPSGMIPVRFTRADGQRKILALMATELVGTVEGATAGERTLTLPPEDSFFEGGGGSSILHPWAIYKKTEDSVTYFKIELNSRVYSGTGSYDNIAVTGLNAWIGAQEGYILLKGTVVENEVTAHSIEWGEDGSTPRAEFDGTSKEQTDVTIRLGYAYLDEDNWKIRQDVFGQLTLITTCYDGKPCLCYMQT